MSKRVILPVTLELCSDTIFGSGFSIPGGEDVAVCRNEDGYPYVKGATLKGLLRESLENLAVWTGADASEISALLGREGWAVTPEDRSVRFTALTLEDPPRDPEDCYDLRTFTSLEGGVVKEGTLRSAACVRKGLVFSGQLECAEEDVPLLSSALAGIKWAGTMRSRGFGSLRLRAGAPEALPEGRAFSPCRCIRYRLRSDLPLIITDLTRSSGNSYETQNFIPGAAVRGAVLGRLSARAPQWFAEHRRDLLTRARFLDAVPVPVTGDAGVPLPSLKGFYEDKAEKELTANIVLNENLPEGTKRARLGSFCSLAGGEILYWSPRTGGTLRIQRGREGKETQPFQVRFLEEGQHFEGCILLEDPSLAPELAKALGETLWLGADRYAGFGKCTVSGLEAAEEPAWLEAYGFREDQAPGGDLCLLAVSPLTMLDDLGRPCGLNEARLAQKLGVESVKLRSCSTSLVQNGSYNRTWHCRAPAVRMYDRGSLFRLECRPAPSLEALRRVQREGLGVRRAEGFGQILFLPVEKLEQLKSKRALSESGGTTSDSLTAKIRRGTYAWVERTVPEIRRSRLSKSQLGSIQVLCEEAIRQGGDCAGLLEHLDHNLTERGVEHGSRFQEISGLIRRVLDAPLGETVGVPECEDSPSARLELLCLLFDHSRKGKEET